MKNRIIPFMLILLLSPAAYAGGQKVTELHIESEKTVTITDYSGKAIEVSLPVKKIVTMNSGLSEIVAAMGAVELVVGRCSYSTFPSDLKTKKVVGKNSSSPNMEAILDADPDLVIADSMFDSNKIEILNNRGIPVIIESTSNPERLPEIIRNFGRILEKSDRAEEILTILNATLENVQNRVQSINNSGENRPAVFFENRKPYKSASSMTGHHLFIEWAGGENIAADEPVKSPLLSPEFIALNNPDVIIRRVSGDINEAALENMIGTIYDRPSLQSVDAVRNKRVYCVKSDLFISLRYPVGVSYFASLFYPDQITGDETDEIHNRYIEQLYGPQEWIKMKEIYVYPVE